MSRRSSSNKSHPSTHDIGPAFGNFFCDDMSNDMSTYYPSMCDDKREKIIASTAVPRRKLRKLLLLSMFMTLSMAMLSVHSLRLLAYMGLVTSKQERQDQIANGLLAHLSSQLMAAGLINTTSTIPFPPPPQSCKYKPPLCHLSLPWLYGSIVSLTCALGAMQTISRIRKDGQDHTREIHAIRFGLGGATLLFCVGISELFL